MHTQRYIVNSLELHLFFGRIMKEHSFFLEAGFTPANESFSRQAEFYKREFEKLLCRAIELSEGVISVVFGGTGYGIYRFGGKTDGDFYRNHNRPRDNPTGNAVVQRRPSM